MAALRNFLTRRSFERRTRELVTPLYRAARALTSNESDAEDLVHDAYIKGFLAFREGEFTSVASCRAWLFRIMVNTFRDHYRRRTRMPEVELVIGEDDSAETDGGALAAEAPGPDMVVEAAFLRSAIMEAVFALPPEVRIAVTLFFIEEMKYREIAEVVGCPIGTVMSRVARGREILQARLMTGWRGDSGLVDPRILNPRTQT
jgi:RNA polymerase sigma-70 factor, ECF subfamily